MKANLPSTWKLDVFTFLFNFLFVVEAFCIGQVYYEPKFELQQHCNNVANWTNSVSKTLKSLEIVKTLENWKTTV